ncbi:MAG: MFS transporter [Kiritimatiellia bacterium]
MKTRQHLRYDRYLFAMCGLGGLLYGIDMGLIAAALPYIRETSGYSSTRLASVVAAVLLGTIPAKFVAAPMAERFGRLSLIRVAALVFAAAVPFICLSGNDFALIFTGRVLQGFGCGLIGFGSSLYVSECVDAKQRGRGAGMLQLLLTIGLVVAAVLGLGVTKAIGPAESPAVSFASKQLAWQIIFWSSVPPAILLFFGTFRLRESPRWLFRRGRWDDAYASLLANNPPEAAQAIMDEMASNQREAVAAGDFGRRESFFRRRYLVPLLIALGVNVCTQATGVNSILNYSVVLMQKAGLAGTDANWADTAIKFANFAMTIVALVLVDRRGRKFLLTLGSAGIMVSLAVTGGVFLALERGWLLPGMTAGVTAAAALVAFISFFAVGPGVCCWLASTELMPTRIRATGMMICDLACMGLSYALAQLFLPWSHAFGESSVFLVLAGFGVLYLLISVFAFPETKGRSLEEIERHFAAKEKGR